MANLVKLAESEVEKLLRSDEDQLYEQLGIRAKAIAQDLTKGGSFGPEVTYDEVEMGIKEDVLDFGQRLFRRWNLEAYKLICGSEPEDQKDREDLIKAFGISEVGVAAALSALLVTHLGLAAPLAVVVAALVTKRFFTPAYDEFCAVWEKKLPKAD